MATWLCEGISASLRSKSKKNNTPPPGHNKGPGGDLFGTQLQPPTDFSCFSSYGLNDQHVQKVAAHYFEVPAEARHRWPIIHPLAVAGARPTALGVRLMGATRRGTEFFWDARGNERQGQGRSQGERDGNRQDEGRERISALSCGVELLCEVGAPPPVNKYLHPFLGGLPGPQPWAGKSRPDTPPRGLKRSQPKVPLVPHRVELYLISPKAACWQHSAHRAGLSGGSLRAGATFLSRKKMICWFK